MLSPGDLLGKELWGGPEGVVGGRSEETRPASLGSHCKLVMMD